MSGEWDGLRAAAELLPDDAFEHEGDCGGTMCAGCGHCCHSIAKCDHECDEGGGCSTSVDTDDLRFRRDVLAALDRLQAAEAAVERVRAVVAELRRPDPSLVGRIMSPSMRTIADALEGHESGVTGSLGPPQAEEALGSSLGPEGAQGASGAESDRGGRGDGEGLG